jgi:hypothetical protein
VKEKRLSCVQETCHNTSSTGYINVASLVQKIGTRINRGYRMREDICFDLVMLQWSVYAYSPPSLLPGPREPHVPEVKPLVQPPPRELPV